MLAELIDDVPWSLAMTIAFTAILTFLVQLFFVYRIFRLSDCNYLFAIPLIILTCARLCFACLSTAKLIALQSLERFAELYAWCFSTGLFLSALTDILVMGLLCYLLFTSHKQNSSMNGVLDKFMLYAFENGAITCAATVSSLVCWLVNHTNLIFMALHFVISTFYANSLLASLNTRKTLQATRRRSNSGDRSLAIMFADNFESARKGNETPSIISPGSPGVLIPVERTQLSVSDTNSGRAVARGDSLAKADTNSSKWFDTPTTQGIC